MIMRRNLGEKIGVILMCFITTRRTKIEEEEGVVVVRNFYRKKKNARRDTTTRKNINSSCISLLQFTFCAHARAHGVLMLCGRARKKSHVSKSHLDGHKYLKN